MMLSQLPEDIVSVIDDVHKWYDADSQTKALVALYSEIPRFVNYPQFSDNILPALCKMVEDEKDFVSETLKKIAFTFLGSMAEQCSEKYARVYCKLIVDLVVKGKCKSDDMRHFLRKKGKSELVYILQHIDETEDESTFKYVQITQKLVKSLKK